MWTDHTESRYRRFGILPSQCRNASTDAVTFDASTRPPKRVPPQAWFGVSAIFHYLGPSFAVLLFPAVGVLGVAWFRIASAALIFAPFTRPVEDDIARRQAHAPVAARPRRLPRRDEHRVLSRARPAADEPRRRDGIRRHDRRRAVGLRTRAQPARARPRRDRRIHPDRCEMVDRSDSACSGRCSTPRCSSATSCSATRRRRAARAAASSGSAPRWRSRSSS